MQRFNSPQHRAFILAGSALALAATFSFVSALPAAADPKHGRGYKKHRHGRGVVVVEAPRYRRVYAAPVFRPRYVTYQPNRVLVVQPAPYVAVNGRIGPVDISAVFGPRATYHAAYYGCNFCDARFSSYGSYRSHVLACGYRPANVNVIVHPWDDGRYAQGPGDDCGNGHVAYDGYDDGYDDDYGYGDR
jgi:hypothetical protein